MMKKEKGDLDRASKETMKALDAMTKAAIADQKTEVDYEKIKAQSLSKLEECEIGPEEFSKLAELNSKIGIITGTNDIVNSLALSSENVLTQYLKENC